MNNIRYLGVAFYFLTIVVIGCDDNSLSNMENCGFTTKPQAPEGWIINKLNSERLEGTPYDFHMVSNKVGYLLMSAHYTADSEVLKTLDGGITWTSIYVNEIKRQRDIFFQNENIGYITLGYPIGGYLFKTVDGGNTWEGIQVNGIAGFFRDIQIDSLGNLYSVTYSNQETSQLIKSEDQGINWQVIFESDEIKRSESGLSFKLYEDRIFISGENGDLIVTDLNGQHQGNLNAGSHRIEDFDIFDKNNIVVEFHDKLVRTEDGGTNWIEIYNGKSSIIDFINPNEILAILNISCCFDYDVCYSNDAMALSNNQASTWTEGETVQWSLSRARSVFKTSNAKYKLLLGASVYEIVKE